MDRLEQQYEGKLKVIRLDIQQTIGKELAPVYRFEFTPTFIFFDAQGNEVWRTVGELNEPLLHESMETR